MTYEEVKDWWQGKNLPPFEERATTEEVVEFLIGEVGQLREAVAGLTDQRNELQFLYDGQAEMLRKIRRVATGEDQVADDDTDGLAWIADYITNGPESV